MSSGSCGKNLETEGSGTRFLSGNLWIPFTGSDCFLPENDGIGRKLPEISNPEYDDRIPLISNDFPSGYGEFLIESGFYFLVNSGRNTVFSRSSSGQRICPDVTGSCLCFPAGILLPLSGCFSGSFLRERHRNLQELTGKSTVSGRFPPDPEAGIIVLGKHDSVSRGIVVVTLLMICVG